MTSEPYRVEELWQGAGADILAARPRIQRHLERLRQQEAVVRGAVEEIYEESWQALGELGQAIDSVFRLIEIEMRVAAVAAAGELATDAASFTHALAAELATWDLYLERLQASTATATTARRARAEDALRGLRAHRNALAQLLAQARSDPECWRGLRPGVAAVRRELERSVDATASAFD